MTKAYVQIQKQIEALTAHANALRAKEIDGVIARIKEAIEHYGISRHDLFGTGRSSLKETGKTSARSAGAKRLASKAPSPAKFTDGAGQTWSGRGKRPNWFKTALAAGKTPEDLLIAR